MPCPEGMSYAEWLRSKDIGICVKMNLHEDSGLPQEYINHAKTPELFELNKQRQGRIIDPEDM